MKKRIRTVICVTAVLAVGIAMGLHLRDNQLPLLPSAQAAGGKVKSPTSAAPERYAYYPGTEELRPDEMRVTACGTGMPAARRGQAATCWLVELGNGDKLLFDIGTGSMANIASYMIPYDYLDKVFLSHLHTDHFGDLPVLWAGGWTAGRTGALKVLGPSGQTPELGTKYALEGLYKHYAWDRSTRSDILSTVPGVIKVTEFDYRVENQVIYQENGVTIRSWPAIHAGDGPVSYALEWNGYKFVFGGDTYPNKWFIKYATDADFAIHECFVPPGQLVKYYGMAPPIALRVGTKIHTSPPAFGKVMSTIKPRHAVAYHFFNEEGTRYQIYEDIRQTYEGPLSMATDNMVWNIRRDEIIERMAVTTEDAWSVPSLEPPPRRTKPPVNMYSKEIMNGRWDVSDAEEKMLKTFGEKFNIDLKKFK
ncbi:MAG: guanitoxin biosynthesis MBL fold metallo-hydrolase GntH [Nitrospirales bacterium]